jgi:hypothetical protein
MVSLAHISTHWVLKTALRMTQGGHYRRLLEASKTPRDMQAEVLNRILATNAETAFGKRHGLSHANNIDDYRRAVPIQTYEDLRPLIDRQELTGEQCLTREPPVYYHRTSGTVGTPKDIPVTEAGLRRTRQHQKIFAHAVAKGTKALGGKVFGITGQAVEGKMPGGTPFGSASGLLYQSHSKLVRSRYVLPAELSDIEAYQARYLAMAAYGLSEPSVTCIGTANPSTLVRLLSLINQQPDAILRAVADGGLPDAARAGALPDNALRPKPRRAAYLAGRLATSGQLTYADIWPDLKAVTTWTGGSCAVPLRALSASLPEDARIIELGYLASEVQGTVNIDVRQNICLPTLLDTVFEFAERGQWEDGDADFLSLHELDIGGEYYVFVTTAEGLYRYDMNDIVRVTGRANQTPTLAFVQKGKGVTSITGEKLYEVQVLEAVMTALGNRGIQTNFFIMLADQEAARYTLYVEAGSPNHGAEPKIAADLDRSLRCANIEYDNKRGSGRLVPLTVRWLRGGAGEKYRADRVAAGQRDAQFKYLHLQYAHECAFDFDAFTEPG